MAKIDKSQYTKNEWRRIKEQRKQEKLSNQSNVAVQETTPVLSSIEKKYHVVCLKHGTKYSAEYVNKLYNMIRKNCTLDFEFWCLTENAKEINSNVKILELPNGLTGWWCKPYVFSKDLPLKGTILYIDLDVVISSNIDKLFTYSPGHWCTVRDFTRAMRPKWHKYNSSVVRFEAGQLDHVWTEFDKNKKEIQRKFFGDQDWLFEATQNKKAALYPDSWILSWKWEVRRTKEFTPGGTKGHKKFKHIENVKPRIECCICVFHGDPNPHNCEDPWVVDNWK